MTAKCIKKLKQKKSTRNLFVFAFCVSLKSIEPIKS